MIFMGALDYYFWQGVKEGFNGNDFELTLPLKLQIGRKCEEMFSYGVLFGRELTTREFNLLTKPKVRYNAKKPVQPKYELKNDDFKGNVDLEGEC